MAGSLEFLDGASISCPSASTCVIAGGKGAFETGSLSGGTWTWSVANAPSNGLNPPLATTNPALQLSSVACESTTCISVGTYNDANSAFEGLIETGSLGPAPPQIDSVTPTGPLDGGNTVVIDGTGFEDAGLSQPTVEFTPEDGDTGDDTIDGLSATIVDDTEITVTAPDAAPDATEDSSYYATDVEVSFDDSADPGTPTEATDATPGDSDYLFGGPTIASISPPAGPLAGGTTVTVKGSGFSNAGLTLTKAVFDPTSDLSGSAALAAGDPTVVSDTEMTLTAPDATSATDGKLTLDTAVELTFSDPDDNDVPATADGGAATSYTYGAPVIESISPPAGPLDGANQVTITGSGFQDAGFNLDKVTFDPATEGVPSIDGIAASVLSDTEIKVTVPDATAAAAGKSTLTAAIDVLFTDPSNGDAQVSAVDATSGASTYTYGAPVIDSLSPPAGPLGGGNTVTITGSGFQDTGLTLNTVAFDPTTTAAALDGGHATVVSDTEITVTAPDATASADGKATLGAKVKVTFDDPDAQDATIAALPADADDDAYSFGVPVIDSITPAAGPLVGGNTITITGSGFVDSGLSLDKSAFEPSGGAAIDGADTTVVSDTEVTVTAPDATAAADGKATLSTTISLTFTDPSDPDVPLPASFSPTADDRYTFGAPVIESISPQAGPLAGGDTVTITGSGFQDSGLTFGKVVFAPTGGADKLNAAAATVVSDTEITVTTPDATATAAGKAILATTIDVGFNDPAAPGSDINAIAETAGAGTLDYTFGAPVVDSITPAAGALDGGTKITVTGSGFENMDLSLDSVSFEPTIGAGAAAPLTGTEAQVISDTELTVITPDATSEADGKQTLSTQVGVFFTDTQSPDDQIRAVAGDGVSVLDYTFGAPVVDSVNPSAGPLVGGNEITITGSGFEDGGLTFDKVDFDPTSDTDGSTAIDGVDATVVSDTEITVTAPDATERGSR